MPQCSFVDRPYRCVLEDGHGTDHESWDFMNARFTIPDYRVLYMPSNYYDGAGVDGWRRAITPEKELF